MSTIDDRLFDKLKGFDLPRGPLHLVLQRMANMPGRVGASAKRKTIRRDVKLLEKIAFKRLTDLTKSLQLDDIFVDLGANVGAVSKLFAEAGIQVVAYEPDPWNFEILERNLAGFDTVTLVQKAVGAKTDVLKLERPSGVKRGRGAQNSTIMAGSFTSDTETFDVEVLSYADMIAALPKKPAVVKMDIEGAELEILEAMMRGEVDLGTDLLLVETHEFMFPDVLERYLALKNWARGLGDQIDLNWH
ncbi:MAG: FkbM family methyltransferase [Cognatishimia sp.]|nr:FkbM family methyltransferase [Cognatishimia sp.]